LITSASKEAAEGTELIFTIAQGRRRRRTAFFTSEPQKAQKLRSVSGRHVERTAILICRDQERRLDLAVFQFGPTGASFASRRGMLKPIPPADDPRTYAIIGAALEVHRVLGAGFLELFYKDALAIEFRARGIPFEAEVPCVIEYKGLQLRGQYRMDFLCFDEVVLEIKARSATGPADHAQVISYLASSKRQVGLLLNFGGQQLEHKRFVRTARLPE
jgi:GxxExxY protein